MTILLTFSFVTALSHCNNQYFEKIRSTVYCTEICQLYVKWNGQSWSVFLIYGPSSMKQLLTVRKWNSETTCIFGQLYIVLNMLISYPYQYLLAPSAENNAMSVKKFLDNLKIMYLTASKPSSVIPNIIVTSAVQATRPWAFAIHYHPVSYSRCKISYCSRIKNWWATLNEKVVWL